MSRRRKIDQDFSPTPVQAMILDAVEKGVDWKHISTLLNVVHATGQLDPSVKWDDEGNALLGAVMNARGGSSREQQVPLEILEQIIKWDKHAIEHKNNIESTPLDLFLDGATEKSSTALATLPWWVKHANKHAFFAWTPFNRYGEKEKTNAEGAHLVDLVLDQEDNQYQQNNTTQLPLLFGLGVSPHVRDERGALVFHQMKNVCQWEAFLEAGGNPRLVVNLKGYDDEKDKRELWQYLVDVRYKEMEATVRQWASTHASEDIRQKNANDYWATLKVKVGHYPSPGDIIGFLKSHDEFLTLRDDQGRNCLMYGIRMHASAWKTLEQKRFSGMLADVDHEGHSLWYYALKNGNRCTPDTVSFLATNKVPCDVPDTGWGLVARVMLQKDERISIWERMGAGKEAGKKIGAALKADELWAVPDAVAPQLFTAIVEAVESSRNEASDTLLPLINAHADSITNPYLLGAAAVLNLADYNGKPEIALECIQRGGVMPVSDAMMTKLRSRSGNDAVWTAYQATLDRQTLQQDVIPVQSPRRDRRI